MPRQLLWIALIGISLVATLFFGGKAGWQLNRWQQLKAHAPAQVEAWNIVKLGRDRYILEADYHYQVEGQDFFGSGRLLGEHFLNDDAAQARQAEIDELNAWFHPSRPDHAQLGRFFPVKNCFYALLTAGLLVYFIWLARSVGFGEGDTTH